MAITPNLGAMTDNNGLNYNAQLETNFLALVSCFAGTVDPASYTPSQAFAGMFWADTRNQIMKQRNNVNNSWAQVGTIDNNGIVAWNNSASTPDATTTTKGIIKLAGDLTGTANLPALIPTGVTPGNYINSNLTVDLKGRITSITNGSSSAVGIHNIEYYGVVGDGATNNNVALQIAQTALSTMVNPTLIFPPGTYCYTISPNWAVNNAKIIANGEVIFKYTGTGNSVIIDAGSGSQNLYNMYFGDFIVQGGSGSTNGVFIRGVHHSYFGFNVRGCGTSYSGLLTNFSVCSYFKYICSNNEGSWSSGNAPTIGMTLTQRNTAEQTSYCLFENPILEGVGVGALLDYALGNTIIGGTMEGCTDSGLEMTANATHNKIYNTDYEVNTNYDIIITGGGNNLLQNVDTEKIVSITSGSFNRIIGGSHKSISLSAGVVGTLLTNFIYNKTGSGGSITDNGTNTKKTNICNAYVGTWTSDSVVTQSNYLGRINYDGSAYRLPSGWSSGLYSTGIYKITHNLNTDSYVVVANTSSNDTGTVQRVLHNDVNSFYIVTELSTSGSLANYATEFILTTY